MRWKWDLRPPEFLELPKKERTKLWHKVYFRSLRRPRMFVPLLALVIVHMMVIMLTARFLRGNLPLRMSVSAASIAILIVVFGRYSMYVMRDELRAHASHSCLNCWYDLTGNESGICPECGTPRRADPA